jgi:acetyl esterase/lipase
MPRLVLPFSRRPGAVERIGGIAYGEHPQQVLDVYRLRGTAEAAPVMIFLHAGGYFTGSRRREGRALLYRMALRGWVCVSADYRLMPEATWPDHLVDAKRVIAWVRGEGTRRGIHPTAVTVVGSSAGAHMAALCAVLPDRPALQPGFESADTSIDAAVCLYGYYGRYYGLGPDPQLPSSPFDVDAADAPPCMVVHGDHDGYAPVAPARAFVRHLRDSSPAPVVYAELPSGEHGFDTFASARGAAVVDGAELFLTEAVGAA